MLPDDVSARQVEASRYLLGLHADKVESEYGKLYFIWVSVCVCV